MPGKAFYKTKKRQNAAKKIQAAWRRRRAAKKKPRQIIRSSVNAAPNTYSFSRGYDHPFAIGVADETNGVFLNTDNLYQIVELHTKFNKLPDYTEFKSLFSEYKITSIYHKLVPYYSINMPSVQYTPNHSTVAIPNYEIFAMPVNSSVREQDLPNKTGAEIDSYINQSQRKARRIMPSRTQNFKTLKPKVVGYKGPIDKDAGTSLMVMEAPTYLNTDPAALVAGGVDQTDVIHYGMSLLIRRVDGLALPSQHQGDPHLTHMGFRMENKVYFRTRKVQ